VNDGRKIGSPYLPVEIGAFVTSLLSMVGAGLQLLRDAADSGAWFWFVASALVFLLCIPLLVSAVRNRTPSPHHEKYRNRDL
jgi:hypothetical protein